jgi:hypothetical protein
MLNRAGSPGRDAFLMLERKQQLPCIEASYQVRCDQVGRSKVFEKLLSVTCRRLMHFSVTFRAEYRFLLAARFGSLLPCVFGSLLGAAWPRETGQPEPGYGETRSATHHNSHPYAISSAKRDQLLVEPLPGLSQQWFNALFWRMVWREIYQHPIEGVPCTRATRRRLKPEQSIRARKKHFLTACPCPTRRSKQSINTTSERASRAPPAQAHNRAVELCWREREVIVPWRRRSRGSCWCWPWWRR